jgi:thiamine-monophosphate kinase
VTSEDALVAQLRDLIERHQENRRLLNAIGDDAALWQPSRSHRSVMTTDMLVENVHFDATMPLHDVGWRAMAANLSDLAAMGSRPVLATVALGFERGFSWDSISELYSGMLAVAAPNGCAIAGGDLSNAPATVVSIAAIGEVRPSSVKGRGGARAGDVIAVTGPLGASRAGLHLRDNPRLFDPSLKQQALHAHRRPQPRLAEGRWLAAGAAVHAMMDVSDGLSTDLARMCSASLAGALIERVPVAESARSMALARGEDPQEYALAGGEDFELLVAVAARAFQHVAARFRKRFGHALEAVGRFREGRGVFAVKGSGEIPIAPTGWDHVR